MAIIYFQNPWQSSYKSPWKIMIIYFISFYKLSHYLSYITIFIIFISKTHDNYLSYMPIMNIYRKTHKNITLFHYNGCYHILFETYGYCLYLKSMVNIILKKILKVII